MHVEECWCRLVVKSCPTLCDPMDGSMSGFPVLHCLPQFAQINVHWVGNAYPLPSYPLTSYPQPSSSLPAPQSLRASGFFFFSVSWLFCIRSPKYQSFSFSNNPFNEYSGLISFRIDYFDLLADKGTLKSLLQHHHSKASILSYGPSLTSVHDYWKKP